MHVELLSESKFSLICVVEVCVRLLALDVNGKPYSGTLEAVPVG